MLRLLNHAGMALFVFLALTGIALCFTGNLHLGAFPKEPSEAARLHEHDEPTEKVNLGHNEEDEAHKSQCATCLAEGKRCTACEQDAFDEDMAEITRQECEHDLRILDCDRCRFEAGVVKTQPFVEDTLLQTDIVGSLEQKRIIKLTGQVQLDETRVIDVVPTGSGRVKTVKKLLGQNVEESDVLAVIHSADFGEAKARFLEVQAQLELAQSTFAREKELFGKKISSEAEYLDAQSKLQAAQAYYTAAEKRLYLFGLQREQILAIGEEINNERFGELVLRSPRTGTIIAQNVSPGKMVDTTASLYTVADLSNVWVWCDLYEKDLAILHQQLSSGRTPKATLHVKAYGQKKFEGEVDLIGSLLDEHTRTAKVRIQVKNEERKLKPFMFAEVEIQVPLPKSITAIPGTAVLSDEGKHFVFQHWKDHLWVRRDVEVGRNQDQFVEIVAGVPQGARIVIEGGFMLKSDILREKMGAGCAD